MGYVKAFISMSRQIEVTEDFKTLIFEEQLKDLITQKSSCYAILLTDIFPFPCIYVMMISTIYKTPTLRSLQQEGLISIT